ncbi:MAG: cytochrome biosis protein transrane region [Frankiales bacterium]|nr:cytochrome biosis protein transrane region [Frankiales bacterium]
MKSQRSLVAAAALSVLAVVAVLVVLTTNRSAALKSIAPELRPVSQSEQAPELAGISHFDNSPRITMADLRGKVVLVDFWTYTCINCRRTLPFLRALQKTYPGLTILGVHSPEFGFEKVHDNVVRAVKELDVTWPVAEDPQMLTWQAFQNEYWPAEYLVDQHGLVRYTSIGEGNEGPTENAIRSLLGATGPRASVKDDGEQGGSGITPETYYGTERGEASLTTGPVKHLPEALELDKGATLTVPFTARDVYATTSPASGPVTLDVTLDGKPVPAGRRGSSLVEQGGRTVAVLSQQDLLHLVTGPSVAPGALKLTALGDGAQFFTFTYGA